MANPTPEYCQSVARALSLPPAAVARCLSDVATARTVAAYLPGTGPASVILAFIQAGIPATDAADLIRDVQHPPSVAVVATDHLEAPNGAGV